MSHDVSSPEEVSTELAPRSRRTVVGLLAAAGAGLGGCLHGGGTDERPRTGGDTQTGGPASGTGTPGHSTPTTPTPTPRQPANRNWLVESEDLTADVWHPFSSTIERDGSGPKGGPAYRLERSEPETPNPDPFAPRLQHAKVELGGSESDSFTFSAWVKGQSGMSVERANGRMAVREVELGDAQSWERIHVTFQRQGDFWNDVIPSIILQHDPITVARPMLHLGSKPGEYVPA